MGAGAIVAVAILLEQRQKRILQMLEGTFHGRWARIQFSTTSTQWNSCLVAIAEPAERVKLIALRAIAVAMEFSKLRNHSPCGGNGKSLA